ncbi:hypothetical protein Tco_1337453 [Tanacetum coccineum]
MMSFLSAVVTSRYPITNNQLRNSSNPRQQATINDGRVTLQLVQGRQISFATEYTRHRLQEQVEELWDKGESRNYRRVKPHIISFTHNAAYSSDDLDAYDLIVDERYTAKVFFRVKGFPDALAKVHNPDNVDNKMINQGVQVTPSSEQASVMNHSETEITSDSNIIPYSQYVIESQQSAVQNSNSSAQQDALILSVIEQLKTQKAQQLEPKLYDGNVIKNTCAIVNPWDSCYDEDLNAYEEEFVPKTELSVEPAFWSQNSMNSSDPSPSCRLTKVEVPKELPKVSMFLCIIGYEHINANFFPLLSINVMSKSFYNSIMKDKVEYKGKNVVGAFINVPIFVGNFSVVTDFAVVEDMDAYRDDRMGDVIVGKPFCRKIRVKARWFDGMITIFTF